MFLAVSYGLVKHTGVQGLVKAQKVRAHNVGEDRD